MRNQWPTLGSPSSARFARKVGVNSSLLQLAFSARGSTFSRDSCFMAMRFLDQVRALGDGLGDRGEPCELSLQNQRPPYLLLTPREFCNRFALLFYASNAA